MEVIIVFLTIMLILLTGYLFLLKKDLNRITNQIKESKHNNSNTLIHSEISSKELSNLIKEINTLLENTKREKINFEKNTKSVNQMIRNISHDLRTPLTSALGYIDMILNSNLTEAEKKKELKIIENRLKRLEELINSFFEFSKMISVQKIPELEKVNLVAIIEECLAHYYEDYKKENRAIILNLSQPKYTIVSNKEMLIRIFDNLIGNSLKHSDGDLNIIVTGQDKIKISFLNHLSNSELDIKHIFDEFYTTDIARTKGSTGLGLAIAKEFTEILNGKICAKKKKKDIEIVLEF